MSDLFGGTVIVWLAWHLTPLLLIAAIFVLMFLGIFMYAGFCDIHRFIKRALRGERRGQ